MSEKLLAPTTRTSNKYIKILVGEIASREMPKVRSSNENKDKTN